MFSYVSLGVNIFNHVIMVAAEKSSKGEKQYSQNWNGPFVKAHKKAAGSASRRLFRQSAYRNRIQINLLTMWQPPWAIMA